MREREALLLNPCSQANKLLGELSSAGWSVTSAASPREARQLMEKQNFLVGMACTTSQEDDIFSREALELISEFHHMEWIALLDEKHLESPELFRTFRHYFYDYHTLPPDITRLTFVLGHAWGLANMQRDEAYEVYDSKKNPELGEATQAILGDGEAVQTLLKNIRKVAKVEAPVLITGDSGTGKELTAHAIHQNSNRSSGPFVALNCGALPANLIQSELFGHEKGSFTGATAQKLGSIEAANGGTLFLDEIGELPLEMQVNLLRFLQEGTICRVGDTQERAVDVRIIAATHVDLEKAKGEGTFREDLFYRINVLNVVTPTLRERKEDIELLAEFYFKKFCAEKSAKVKGFSKQALTVMQNHSWEGNVRELINRIRRAMVMCEGRLITPDDLGLERRTDNRQAITLEEAREKAEKETILKALKRNRDNVSNAAKDLNVSRVTLYRLIKKCGLGNEDEEDPSEQDNVA